MNVLQSREELKEYCLRKLGKPLLEINVAEEQIEDCIDDTLQLWQERCFDGYERVYLKYQVTQDDRERYSYNTDVKVSDGLNFEESVGGWLQMPDLVIGIDKVWKFTRNRFIDIFGYGFAYHFFLDSGYNFYSQDLLNYTMVFQYLETIDFLLNNEKPIRYNKTKNRLYIDTDWAETRAGDFFIIECYRALDPEEYKKIYNERFIKQYCTALIKKQWGANLRKFIGVSMPGGVQYNADAIYQDAVEELRELKDEMKTTWEIMPLDMVG